MPNLIPPVLCLMLLIALSLLWGLHPETGYLLRADRAMPWDVPLAVGVTVLIWARVHFLRKEAEIHTFRTPTSLVTDGPFRFSRNPMYLGFTLVLFGAALYTNLWCALLAPLAFFIASAYWYVPHEERTLRSSFGPTFDDYAWKTRRWL